MVPCSMEELISSRNEVDPKWCPMKAKQTCFECKNATTKDLGDLSLKTGQAKHRVMIPKLQLPAVSWKRRVATVKNHRRHLRTPTRRRPSVNRAKARVSEKI